MLTLPNEFFVKEPYPDIRPFECNNDTLILLQNLYCSQNSESVATLTYSYQHIITKPFNQQLCDAFIKIAMVEMRHLDLLGNAIAAAGGIPVFADSQNAFLSGKWVDYVTNVNKLLEIDIKNEIAAAKAYENASGAVCNEELARLLLRISLDEKLHAEILADIMKQLKFWIG